MKRVYVNEEWCLGCHLCEYNCAFANSNEDDMILACKDKTLDARITIKDRDDGIHFAVNCRECKDPLCLKSCIAGAIFRDGDMIRIDKDRCVLCYSCIMACPYGALRPTKEKVMGKCELCTDNGRKVPACVEGCPNKAIVFEER